MGRSTATVKTLVVTDLVNSTRLFATLGDRPAARLSARHERLARDLIWESGGREIDKTDGFLLLFDRAVDGVRFALAYHRALATLSEDEGVELTARVGIHLGEVYERRNPPEDVERGAKPVEIEGVAKPVAARVMALASSRQTLLTRTAFDLARQGAASEIFEVEGTLRWLAHGPYRLKGVEEPVEIFEVGVSGFAPLLVPKSTVKARRAVSADDELTLGWRPAPGLEIPRREGWFVSEKLGEGGFGEVWLGRNAKTGEARVFKFCYRADRLRSLQREVTLFRLLKETLGTRADIARILDWNFDSAPYFLESEYTEGGNLLEWAAEQGGAGRVPLETRLELLAQVAEALAAAHSVGVLHKDVKPSNVLIITGSGGGPRVRLTDFGIGVLTDRGVLADRGITLFDLTEMVAETSGSAGGTHLYMAPELVEGRTPTVQADLYALGVMLYQFLVGDFSRALAPGWRRDVDDEILREDLAALVDGNPERRLHDAREAAERLRTVEERRVRAEAERRDREQREAERRALERAHRRRRISAVVAVVALLVLAVVSSLAYQAVKAREEAERRRAQAESLIGFMVGDLRKKLEPIGKLDILDEIGNQAMAYFEAVPADELTDDELFRRSQALYQIGEVRSSQGDLGAAMLSYSESLALVQRLTDDHPSNVPWRRGLLKSHFGVGYVLWRQGRLDDALPHFHRYAEIAQSLAREDPDNPEWQLELAYSYSNIGSIDEAMDKLDEAEQSFERSLAIRETLFENSPSDPKTADGLATAHRKLGFILNALGRPTESLHHLRENLRLREALVHRKPDDAALRHDQATARSYVAYVLEATGELEQALQNDQEAESVLAELVTSDRSNLVWKRDLAAVRLRMGELEDRLGRSSTATAQLELALDALQELVAKNPTDLGWRKDLAKANVTMGRVLLGQHRRSDARDSIRRGLASALEISKESARASDLQELIGEAYLLLGDLRKRNGSPSLAREAWTDALRATETGTDLTNDRLLKIRSRTLLRLGRIDEVRPLVKHLLEMGYRDPQLLDQCRHAGLTFDPPDPTNPAPRAS